MPAACHRRDTCRLCGGKTFERVLSLEPTPPANAFVTAADADKEQALLPLDVFFCEDCFHVQLLDVVDPKVLFENYVYVSGTSPVFVKHFEDYTADIMARLSPRQSGLVVDIGSNDGTLLGFFKKAGMNVLGIDPARDIAEKASDCGIETINDFFSPSLAEKILATHGPAALITANNVFAHMDDLAGISEGIASLLADDGLFVFEVSYLADVFEKTLFDTIYHEHLSYHSVKPLLSFFDKHGMELIEAVRIESHGGSLRGMAQKKGGPRAVGASVARAVALEKSLGLDKAETLRAFADRIDARKAELSAVLAGLKAEGKSIAAFGAPAKATTLMYHFKIGPDVIDFIVDDSPLKQNLLSPGMHIPVVGPEVMDERKPDALVILAWNFAEPIMAKNAAFHDRGGRFIIPLPEVRVI